MITQYTAGYSSFMNHQSAQFRYPLLVVNSIPVTARVQVPRGDSHVMTRLNIIDHVMFIHVPHLWDESSDGTPVYFMTQLNETYT